MGSLPLENNIWVALILVAGSIITTFLTIKYKEWVETKIQRGKAPDRMETIFNGYERLIHELQSDLKDARNTNEEQRTKLITMQVKIDTLENSLELARKQNDAITKELIELKSK